jgi:hypothetical protein
MPSLATSKIPLRQRPCDPYLPPELLRPLHVLDFWELLGNQALTAQALQLHQSTVSRTVTAVTQQFRPRQRGDSRDDPSPLRYLRLACRAHRMGAGVLRLASDPLLQPLLEDLPSLQPVPPRFRQIQEWVALIQAGVIDGALVPSPSMETGAPSPQPSWQGVQLFSLGMLDLQLALAPGGSQEVLVPDAALAPLLHRQLIARQWSLHPLGPHRRQVQDWQQIALRRGLALPVAPALLTRTWLEHTQRTLVPLSPGLQMPVWLLMGQEAVVAGTVLQGISLLRQKLLQAVDPCQA